MEMQLNFLNLPLQPKFLERDSLQNYSNSYEQVNFLDLNKSNKFKLKELQLSNYKRIHEDNILTFEKGINIIMPNYSLNNYSPREIPINCDYYELAGHMQVDRLYIKDALEMIELLRKDRNFGVWDYSFFANNNDTQIKAIVEEDNSSRTFIRKQKYRGKEVFREVIGTTKTGRLRIAKCEDIEQEQEFINSIIKDIVIYPKELPCLLRVEYTKNFNYLTEKYPLLNRDILIKDINAILNYYSVGCELVTKKGNIEINNVRGIDLSIKKDKTLSKIFKKLSKKIDSLSMDILFNTNEKYSDKHLELAIMIALEKQLNNDVIVLTNGMFDNIYEEELELCMLMLTEFVKNNQQVIMFYDSPLDQTNINNMEYVIDNYNDKLGYELYNKVWFTEKHTAEEEWANVTIKMNARELIERSEMNYEEKKKLSKKIIREAYNNVVDYTKVAIAFSYGKDSLSVFVILKETLDEMNEGREEKIPYPKLVFCNTRVEFPETYKYKKELDVLLKEWGFEIFETKPKRSFWDIVEKEGFPMFGKAIRKNKNPEIYDKIEKLGIKTCGNVCCLNLKEIPSVELYHELGIELTFVGILAEESNTRKTRWYDLGDTYWKKTEGMYKSQPLIHFTEEDVWKTIYDSKLPYNPIYDMGYWKMKKDGSEEFINYKRNGCIYCAHSINFSGNNMEMLRNTHPKLWNLIMIDKGLGKEIFKFKHGIAEGNWSESEKILLEGYLESKPCHFDTTNWKIS